MLIRIGLSFYFFLCQGFLGLSGAVLIQVYQALFKGKPSTFLLMLALLPTLLSLLFMCSVRTYQRNPGDDKKHLNGFSMISMVVAAYLMILILLENTLTLPLWVCLLTFVLLLLLLSSPLRIAIKAQREETWRLSQTSSIDRSPLIDDSESLGSKKLSAAEDGLDYHEVPAEARQTNASEDKMLQVGEEMNLFQAICTVNFWLLFVSMVCGMGSGLATINNISQIGESLGYSTTEINTLVSLWSIWNYLGRFGAGYISDIFLHRRGWARPLFIIVTLATMTTGHIVIALGFSGNLYVGSILVGICYGSQWSLMPTITSEVFGVLHMGTIFNTIAIASPIGSYLLSVRVIGYFYDKEASGDGNSCNGTHCFMLSFLILASVSFFGFFVASILFFRTRSFYTQVLLRRLRHMKGLEVEPITNSRFRDHSLK
ncbi:unnamed protein product [Ilex paraguariensis]|uniref:Nodulin-like protein n=1 Tax=Ilex paraguariensis TaxID=185542 RepID=A0ABC8UUQ1_9AQUA